MMNDQKGSSARVLARLVDAMNPEQDPALLQRRARELQRSVVGRAGPYTRARALARDEFDAMLADEAPARSAWTRCVEIFGDIRSVDRPASCA